MNNETKNAIELFFSAIQLIVIVIGGILAYFRFWREGVHKPRIEFDLDCKFFGPQNNRRVASFTIHVRNMGNIEHKFIRISLKLRGIKFGGSLENRRKDNRLEFPESLLEAELIPKEFGYFFVRPNVKQQIAFTAAIPDDVHFVLARAAFKYEDSDDLHTAEKVFDVQQTA
jgi:hypothetical protein